MSTQPGMPATGSVRPPRIVHVINSLHTGGAETMLARLVDSADPSRFEHIVLPLLEGGPVAKRVRDAGALAAPLRVDGAAGALQFLNVEVMVGKAGDLWKMSDAQHLGIARQSF